MIEVLKDQSAVVNVNIKGKFTFMNSKSFLFQIDEILKTQCEKLIIKLELIEFMDSAALGALLLTKDRCSRQGCTLSLSKPKAEIAKMLKITKMDKMLDIPK